MKLSNVRIESDGTSAHTQVFAAGVPVQGVARITWSMVPGEPAKALIEVVGPEVTLCGVAAIRSSASPVIAKVREGQEFNGHPAGAIVEVTEETIRTHPAALEGADIYNAPICKGWPAPSGTPLAHITDEHHA